MHTCAPAGSTRSRVSAERTRAVPLTSLGKVCRASHYGSRNSMEVTGKVPPRRRSLTRTSAAAAPQSRALKSGRVSTYPAARTTEEPTHKQLSHSRVSQSHSSEPRIAEEERGVWGGGWTRPLVNITRERGGSSHNYRALHLPPNPLPALSPSPSPCPMTPCLFIKTTKKDRRRATPSSL